DRGSRSPRGRRARTPAPRFARRQIAASPRRATRPRLGSAAEPGAGCSSHSGKTRPKAPPPAGRRRAQAPRQREAPCSFHPPMCAERGRKSAWAQFVPGCRARASSLGAADALYIGGEPAGSRAMPRAAGKVAEAPVASATEQAFSWEDPLDLEGELTEEERMVRDTARHYAQDKLFPRVIKAFREESFDRAIINEMGALGLLGPTIPEQYGGAGLRYVSAGLITRELERVDSGFRSAMSVQSSLVMYPIFAYGTDAQRRKYLPRLATGEIVGCFGLTEPDHGSDPGSMATRAEIVPGGFRLTGAKMWITNSPIADVAVVWAKLDGVIRGFIVERGKGFTTPKIEGKLSL